MFTDAGAGRSEEVLRRLERQYAVIAQVTDFIFMVQPKPPKEVVDVIVFDSDNDVRALMKDAAAFFAGNSNDVGLHARLFISKGDTPQARETTAHELVHKWVSLHLPRAPHWLNEGLAEYLSTVREVDGKIHLGEHPSRRRFRSGGKPFYKAGVVDVDTLALPTVNELMTREYARFHSREDGYLHYAGSWLLVHMLYSDAGHRERLAKFYTALNSKPPLEAWKLATAGWSEQDIEDSYRSYLTKQIMAQAFKTLRTDAQPIPDAVLSPLVTLDAAASEVLVAGFHPWRTKEGRANAQPHIDAARKLQSSEPETLFWIARFDELSGKVAEANKVYDVNPHWRAVVAQMEMTNDTSKVDVPKAVARLRAVPPSPDTLWQLAWLQPEKGTVLLSQCLKLNPVYVPCVHLAAEQAFTAGRIDEAIMLTEYHRALLPHGFGVEEVEKRLKEYKAARK